MWFDVVCVVEYCWLEYGVVLDDVVVDYVDDVFCVFLCDFLVECVGVDVFCVLFG